MRYIRAQTRRNQTAGSRVLDRWRARREQQDEGHRPEFWLMTTGKHRGRPIGSIPDDYLRWMIRVGHTHADRARQESRRRKRGGTR